MLIDQYAWTARNSRHEGLHRLSEVGRLKPNDFGLFDMLGNVMEWCQDTDTPYPDAGFHEVADDLSGTRVVSDEQLRPIRGGAFLYQPADARAGHRNNSAPPRVGTGHPYIGFRIARTLQAVED